MVSLEWRGTLASRPLASVVCASTLRHPPESNRENREPSAEALPGSGPASPKHEKGDPAFPRATKTRGKEGPLGGKVKRKSTYDRSVK